MINYILYIFALIYCANALTCPSYKTCEFNECVVTFDSIKNDWKKNNCDDYTHCGKGHCKFLNIKIGEYYAENYFETCDAEKTASASVSECTSRNFQCGQNCKGRKRTANGIDWTHENLTDCDVSGQTLNQVDLTGATLKGVRGEVVETIKNSVTLPSGYGWLQNANTGNWLIAGPDVYFEKIEKNGEGNKFCPNFQKQSMTKYFNMSITGCFEADTYSKNTHGRIACKDSTQEHEYIDDLEKYLKTSGSIENYDSNRERCRRRNKCQPGEYKTGENCSSCPFGEFQDGIEKESCKDCGAGTFGNKTQLSKCFPCPTGTFQSNVGQTNCTVCPTGSKCPTSGLENKIDCPKGQYQNETGQTECKQCSDGYFTNDLGKTECTICPDGSKCAFSNTSPEKCPKGEYQNEKGQTTCKLCEIGKFQSAIGQTECTKCSEGSISNQKGAEECSLCTAGKKEINNTCVPCPVGTFQANKGATSCDNCTVGNECPSTEMLSPKPCGNNTYQNEIGQTTCKDCSAGSHTENNAGTFTSIGATRCVSCNATNLKVDNDEKSGTECIVKDNCPEGNVPLYNDTEGLHCKPCKKWQHVEQKEGVPTCVDDTNKTECFDSNYKLVGGKQFIVGTNNAEDDSQCLPCPKGKKRASDDLSFNENNIPCVQCTHGKYQHELGQEDCNELPTLPSNAKKVITNSDYTNWKVQSCNNDYIIDSDNNQQCKQCTGFSQKVDESNCQECPAGTYGGDENGGRTGTCTNCTEGKYQPNTNQSECLAPSVGNAKTYLINDDRTFFEVTECDALYFIRETSCQKCEAGKDSNGESCSSCQSNTYRSETMSQCTSVPNGTNSVDTFIVISDKSDYKVKTCKDGWRLPLDTENDKKRCYKCIDGEQGVNGACESCPAGKSNTNDDTDTISLCEPCALGTYQNETKSATCKDCPEGFVALTEGSSECTECPAGSRCPDAQTQEECPSGTYQPEKGKSKCITPDQCTDNTIIDNRTSFECNTCDTGYEPSGSTCAPCIGNTYSDDGTTCKNHTVCGESSTLINANSTQDGTCKLKCSPGKENIDNICVNCPEGKFKNTEGIERCEPCALGSYSLEGDDVCTEVPPSFYEVEPHSSSYEYVRINFMAACPDGFTSKGGAYGPYITDWASMSDVDKANHRSHGCNPCLAGSKEINNSCVACPAGTYQSNEGQSECVSCSGPGLTTTNATHEVNVSATKCILCDNTIQYDHDNTSHTKCVNYEECPTGTAKTSNNKANQDRTCTVCEPRQHVIEINNSDLEKCEPDANYTTCHDSTSTLKQNHAFKVGISGETDDSTCVVCGPGKTPIGDTNNQECGSCSPGYIKTSEQLECTACPEGSYSNTDHTSCIACTINDVNNSATVNASGLRGNANSCVAVTCKDGFINVEGKCLKSQCLRPDISNFALTYDVVESDLQGPTFNVSIQCNVGYFGTPTVKKCDDKDGAEYKIPNGCSKCNLDKAVDQTSEIGSTSSAQCKALSCVSGYKLVSDRCVKCTAGTFREGEGTTCATCAAGSQTNALTGATTCTECSFQSTFDDDSNSSTPCVSCGAPDDGYYVEHTCIKTSDIKTKPCRTCPNYSTITAACVQGSMNTTGSNTVCSCNAGFYMSENNCLQCNNDNTVEYTLNTGLTSANGCQSASCYKGFYLADGVCNACGSGNTTQNDTNYGDETSCIPCPAGRYVDEGACIDCDVKPGQYCPESGTEKHGIPVPSGTFQDKTGPIGSYKQCPENTKSPSGQRHCLPCPPGQTSAGGEGSRCS